MAEKGKKDGIKTYLLTHNNNKGNTTVWEKYKSKKCLVKSAMYPSRRWHWRQRGS